MLCFSPRFFIRQRKRCADVSSRIECIIDSRVILGCFYHASNSLAWVCECMGSIFIVFFFSFHHGCSQSSPASLCLEMHAIRWFFAAFHCLWRCFTRKDLWMRPELVCVFASFSSFFRVVLRAVWQALVKACQTFFFPQSSWLIKHVDKGWYDNAGVLF